MNFNLVFGSRIALIHLSDHILNKRAIMVLLGLQNAFDTVIHAILLNKLKAFDTDEISVCWFRSCLTENNCLFT